MAIVIQNDNLFIENAVISLTPLSGQVIPSQTNDSVEMIQKDKAFIPYVMPIKVNSSVISPNLDKTKHHVYSFSPAKRFELKLYSGASPKPIDFNQTGVVVLGCNIHDWMLGYIYVTDTPLFAKTDIDGQVTFNSLEEGDYKVVAWHPRLKGKTVQRIIHITAKDVVEQFSFELKRERQIEARDFEIEY